MNPHVDPRLIKSFMDTRINRILEPMGITASCAMLLKAIDSNPSGTLTHYSRILHLDKSMVTRMARQLSDGGFVENASENQRDHCLVLTERGREAAVAVDSALETVHAAFFEGVTPEEMEVFDCVMGKINANILADQDGKGDES